MQISTLQAARLKYTPKVPAILQGSLDSINIETGKPTEALADKDDLKALFKHTYGQGLVKFSQGKNDGLNKKLAVGVILSGGQAPGGHNVIAGLYDGLKKGNKDSKLYGFLGGPSGLIDGKYQLFDDATIDAYRNTGGFDIIGSGRTKIETPEQFAASKASAEKLGLDAVVIIGGDDSNTNAALLAEYFIEHNAKAPSGKTIQVIGCPKTIDGDLKNEYIETSFGFDTACKTYSELIGNIERDANSARKYWHFIKLMGRSASHIALECALQTQPNVCLISEEVEKKALSLDDIVEQICKSISARAERGDNFGVVLIPEGLVEFVPEMKALISELNDMLAYETKKTDTVVDAAEDVAVKADFSQIKTFAEQSKWVLKNLKAGSAALFDSLPESIAAQLIAERDPHGNVQVSLIETEKLLISMVRSRLEVLKEQGSYKGKFSALSHFFGYEGRDAFPSNFDADYCYSLGFTAFVLIADGRTGYLSSVRNTTKAASEWIAGGVPLTMMMNMEKRHGSTKPVIKKALVELDGKPFKAFAGNRDKWAVETCYLYPGAIQYYGPTEVCDQPTKTLALEH
ncbi:MAG: diphosphate--fructose-6-phosphate 1-phosphotransferase [Spirochaetaceae bacterium]|jgi:pyrophosphate--fructose-6-phosphate 1-phosphotransferase|nr:diphosphate--fructose-6-phosphate 1-phosphotransferase [Spirochaetaceae bacterium]